ncbi:MAG: hypothetical protein C0606_16270 [Hyphomicrobiales bacterium]|nr:MAG: hypothetical protein C0606_16270 [Hyphomicrobiales bacterium]
MTADTQTPARSNAPAERQAEELIADINEHVAEEVRAVAEAADARIGEIRRKGWAKARRQMHRAIGDMRQEEMRRLSQTRAEIETDGRRRMQHESAAVLDHARPMLAEALTGRWRDAETRAIWIGGLIAHAGKRLAPGKGERHFEIRHAAGWSADDEASAKKAAKDAGIDDVAFVADPAIEVGLVVVTDGARIDATPQAFLADTAFVESALLAEIFARPDDAEEARGGDDA